MDRLSAADVFLMVAIMSVAFLTEIALFILIGDLKESRALGSATLLFASPQGLCDLSNYRATSLVLRELDG